MFYVQVPSHIFKSEIYFLKINEHINMDLDF
jgi:hypothetical protein